MEHPGSRAVHVGRGHHAIPDGRVDANARNVVKGLRDAGFEAYLVGGCVRDLLLGGKPKDFDVATDATPEDVRRVFRRTRLVGRRFRIAHVRFGREIIEVSTFRRHAGGGDDDESDATDTARSSAGVILRDNVYGDMDDDAYRRDFTINALYYDPFSGTVIDYVGGMADLEARTLRLIGQAKDRFREDPVRILRAVRFSAKLGFRLETRTAAAIAPTRELLREIPPARLFDELIKMLLGGAAEAVWDELSELELAGMLFPTLTAAGEADHRLIRLAMRNTDARIRAERPVTPGFLFAVLLWADYRALEAELAPELGMALAREQAQQDALRRQASVISIPRRFSQFVREVWQAQPRLERRLPRSIAKTLEHPRFRAGYDFLALRADAGDNVDADLVSWWTRIQEVDRGERESMIAALRSEPRKRRKRRRRRGHDAS